MQQPGLDFHNIPTPLIHHPGGVRRVVRRTPSPAFAADSRVLLGLELRQPRRGRWGRDPAGFARVAAGLQGAVVDPARLRPAGERFR